MKRWHYALLCLVFLSLGATLILPIFDKRFDVLNLYGAKPSEPLEPLGDSSTFGDATLTGASTNSIEDVIVGGYFQMGAVGGTADSITAKIRVTIFSHKCKCALYDSDEHPVANGVTEQITVPVQAATPTTFNFVGTKPTLVANAWYYIVVWSENKGGAAAYAYYATSGGSGCFYDSQTYDGFPDPFAASSLDADGLCAIYCNYSTAPSNNAPTITASSENPLNQSTNVGLSLAGNYSHFNITVSDIDDATQDMNVTWKTNESGTWKTMGTNTSVNNGTYYCTNVSWVDSYSTKYWWNVSVNDGHGGWDNETYYFTTVAGGNTPPIFSEETPTNNSIGIAIDIGQLSILINDTEGDTFGYEWGCSDGSSNSAAGNTNGTKNLMLNPADLEYNTLYTWWINATDEHGDWTNETYSFTTVAPQTFATNLTLHGLTDTWNVTWNGTIPSMGIHSVYCNNSGDRDETVELDIDVNATWWVDQIKIWSIQFNDTTTNEIYVDNITVLVSTDNLTWGILQDDVGYGMGRFTPTGGYLEWNHTTSPGGCDPFMYGGGDWAIKSNTTCYVRYMLNITTTAVAGTYYNRTGSDWQISIGNYSGGLGPGIIDVEHHNVKAVIETAGGQPPEERISTNVFDYYFYCGNESVVRNPINVFDYYFECGNTSIRTPTQVFDYYFVCGNESVRTQTEIFDFYFLCGNESVRTSTNIFDYYFVCGNETPRISTNIFDYYFYCGNESIARNVTLVFGYYFVCGNESSKVSTNIFDYYFNCSNESSPITATPYNLSLLVINPNPGNGTHNTNYIKKNASGLTTSIDVFYKNFTSPPTSPPGYDSLTIEGTPPANVPCLYNSSTIYANVWANTTGTISTADLFVGQYKILTEYVTYRGFLMFDTSTIPDDAIIDSANVSLIILTFASLTDFNVTLQEVKPPVPHDPLIGTDYNKNAVAGDFGHENTTGYNDDDYFNITLNVDGINYIDKTGDTIFGIRSDQDIVASAPINSEIIGFYAYSFVPFYPKLIISYHTPNPNWKHLVNLTWYSNSSGAWVEYAKSYVNHNGTITVPNVNFSGIDTYYWHLEWESNHTNNGSSQIFEFETVATGNIVVLGGKDQFTLGLILGGLFIPMLGLIWWKKKRKNNQGKN